MSIFGPCSPTIGGASVTTGQEVVDLSEYAKKSHVDTLRDTLHVLNDTAEMFHCKGPARKPIITVWAEENSDLHDSEYEWSFGNGSAGVPRSGYTMMAPGRVLRMGLATSSRGEVAKVKLAVIGHEQSSYGVTKPDGEYSGTSTFEYPLELAEGDRINFRTATSSRNIAAAVVSVLIELDMD